MTGDSREAPASIAIVGVGPGDPELLTLRAVRAIERSAVVLHPGPGDRTGFAVEVVASWLRPDQRVRGMALAMKRGAGRRHRRLRPGRTGIS